MPPRKKKPVVVQNKYDWLHDTLGLYGNGRLTSEQFWGQMNGRGYGQSDIDDWCVEYNTRSKDDAEQAKGRQDSRPTRTAASRNARTEFRG